MEDYIFKYLDKRHTVKGKVVYFKDNNPAKHIELLFGIYAGWSIIEKWGKNRVGVEYCHKYPDGAEHWLKNSKFHRRGGPARTFSDGDEWWYKNGKLHRNGGPAIIRVDGSEEWYLNGAKVKTKWK